MTTPVYYDAATYRDMRGITSTDDDDAFDRFALRASRTIDKWCNRPAGGFVGQTSTKVYDVRADESQRIYVDPLLSVTTLKTDDDGDAVYEVTWTATTDYILYPLNETPYREIQVNQETGSYDFPVGQQTVQIAGLWGEATTVPAPIEEVMDLLMARWYSRIDSPQGIAGNSDVGFLRMERHDPDVTAILRDAGYLTRTVFHSGRRQ